MGSMEMPSRTALPHSASRAWSIDVALRTPLALSLGTCEGKRVFTQAL
jgi:hypothetical protein